MLLLLKLTLTPIFIALITLATRRWGPQVGGVLAGLPVVGGPILLVLALEHGEMFAASAAQAAISAIVAGAAYAVAYSYLALRQRWFTSLLIATLVWIAVAIAMSFVNAPLWFSIIFTLAALIISQWQLRKLKPFIEQLASKPTRAKSWKELLARMVAGAALVTLVTGLSATLGPQWSGILAVYPVMSSVLAMFTHRNEGAAAVLKMLAALVTGFYTFLSFMIAISILLPLFSIATAFTLSLLICFVVQAGFQLATRLKHNKRDHRGIVNS